VVGGVVGGVAGVLGVDERPRFRSYVVEQRRPSYQYREDLKVGAVLPEEGVTYYVFRDGLFVFNHQFKGKAQLKTRHAHGAQQHQLEMKNAHSSTTLCSSDGRHLLLGRPDLRSGGES
jgi:hypothetical protein